VTLVQIVAAPFVRSLYVSRLERLVDRYRRITRLVEDPSHGRTLVEALLFHPGAIRESSRLDRAGAEARVAMARLELENLRAAAPLPAPPQRIERARMLAIADFEWIATELRAIRRKGAAAYRGRLDPLPFSPALLPELSGLPSRGILRAVLDVAASRHGVDGLPSFLWPAPESSPERTPVGPCARIAEGCAERVQIGKRMIAVFRDRGELVAIDDACPHRGGPLGKGKVEGGAVVCPLHGWTFDLRTGSLRTNPNVRVRTHAVVVEEDVAYVVTPGGS
jgi:nitrite reductase/ring-hydroxylating ferredoxin subunit